MDVSDVHPSNVRRSIVVNKEEDDKSIEEREVHPAKALHPILESDDDSSWMD